MKKRILSGIVMITLCLGAMRAPAQESENAPDYSTLDVAVVTPFEGNFFTDLWGNAVSDLDVRKLIHGYSLICWDKEHSGFAADPQVVSGITAYDNEEGDEITLRDGSEEINKELEQKIDERLAMAGIEVVEARINYLAYAPEIAAVMLRRQQASAIIAAREKIVSGAVSMVKMALDKLNEDKIVNLDDEKKASMVSNLLVVLCGDESAQPVVNTGNS